MGERAPAQRLRAAATSGGRTGSALTPYRALIASRWRAQRAYPTSLVLDLFGSFLVGLVELAETWVIFHNVQVLGGLDFHAILLVFGLANFSFSCADLLVGHMDNLPTYIRKGTVDAFYLRPLPLITQLMTSELSIRRLTRIGVGAACAIAGLVVNQVPLTTRTIALLVIAILCGTAIFAGLFVCASGAQFFLIDGAELTNSFTYGGAYASSQPASIFPGALKFTFGYLFPTAFTAYLPTLAILRLPAPTGLPGWLVWCSPVAAAWIWLVAAGTWRAGVRHYQGGGG